MLINRTHMSYNRNKKARPVLMGRLKIVITYNVLQNIVGTYKIR